MFLQGRKVFSSTTNPCGVKRLKKKTFEFFHNSRLIRRIQQNKIDQELNPDCLLNSQVP